MMKRYRLMTGMLAVLLLPAAATAQRDGDRMPMAGGAAPTPIYLMKAGASDLFERQAGQLMSTSRNPGIARFARQMVRDHGTSTAMVKAAALRARLHPRPPMLTREMRANLAALRAARGPARDRLYVMQQKQAHQDALMLQQGYAGGGDVPALRNAAAKIVPVVQHHIAMLDRM